LLTNLKLRPDDLDVNMPGLDGSSSPPGARDGRYKGRIMIAPDGWPPRPEAADRGRVDSVLNKPFTVSDLLTAVSIVSRRRPA